MKKYKFKAVNRTFQLLEQGTVPCSIFQGEPRKNTHYIKQHRVLRPLSPEPEEEVEQHLTINVDGLVWFSAYNLAMDLTTTKKHGAKCTK